jgi:hypothetical protein
MMGVLGEVGWLMVYPPLCTRLLCLTICSPKG